MTLYNAARLFSYLQTCYYRARTFAYCLGNICAEYFCHAVGYVARKKKLNECLACSILSTTCMLCVRMKGILGTAAVLGWCFHSVSMEECKHRRLSSIHSLVCKFVYGEDNASAGSLWAVQLHNGYGMAASRNTVSFVKPLTTENENVHILVI